jgi:ribosomal protein S24E
MAFGVANVYDSIEQAKLVEPDYVVKRNIPEAAKTEEEKPEQKPAEKPKEEVKG